MSELREQIEREVRRINGEMHKDALVNLILEQRAAQCDAIAEEYESAAVIADEIPARKAAGECRVHAERMRWKARELREAKTNG